MFIFSTHNEKYADFLNISISWKVWFELNLKTVFKKGNYIIKKNMKTDDNYTSFTPDVSLKH